jgi:hypothetical protein
MISDLFCAFQPNRVMVPSLPLLLESPETLMKLALLRIPTDAFVDALAARLARMVASGIISINPAPNVGVGMRKLMLRLATCLSKSSCTAVQALALPVASTRPLMTNRAWTPPSRVPSGLKRNRASRMGLVSEMNEGTLFLAPKAVATAI